MFPDISPCDLYAKIYGKISKSSIEVQWRFIKFSLNNFLWLYKHKKATFLQVINNPIIYKFPKYFTNH